MSAILTFLGGSAFRMLWGEASAWLKAKQEHKNEIELMRLQGELEAANFERQQSAIKLQAELGVRTIEVQRDADIAKLDGAGFYKAFEFANKPTGIKFVDGWNGIIRPLIATICVVLWVRALNQSGFVLTDWDQQIIGTVFGFFYADRVLSKRGK